MTRDEALTLISRHVSQKNLVKHMLAVEAVMRRLARFFDEDESAWAMAGLLHDLDYDETVQDFASHGYKTAAILESYDIPEEIIQAIKSHPGHVARISLMDKALYAADPVTGLIVAAALMHPSKKLRNVDTAFIERRFGEKRFAAGANRDQIRTCEEMGLALADFIAMSLEAMQSIDSELGL